MAEPVSAPRAGPGYILLAGPDGSGKSTTADAIVALASGLSVTRVHQRPAVLAGRRVRSGPITDPHGKAPRPAVIAAAKLAVVFLDHLIGGHLRWRRQRRSGLLLVERGWFDMVVDPKRYRLGESLARAAAPLGRLLLRPDVVVLLTGDPDALHDRKPELGAFEVRRQAERWRDIAAAAGRKTIEIDTVQTSPAAAAAATIAALSANPRIFRSRWRRVPLTAKRLSLCTQGAANPALTIYEPHLPRARAARFVGKRTRAVAGRRCPPPAANLSDLWTLLHAAPEGVAAMRSSSAGRLIFGVTESARLSMVVKLGDLTDRQLRHEAIMLTTPLMSGLPFTRPAVVWSGAWGDHYVLATRGVARSSNAPFALTELLPIAHALAGAGPDATPLTHGDFAPWNLVRTTDGTVLLDWESARLGDEPLFDLTHFVVQTGALLGRYGPDRAMKLLCDHDSPGHRLLMSLGRDPNEAGRLVISYLSRTRPTEHRAVRFQAQMARLAMSCES